MEAVLPLLNTLSNSGIFGIALAAVIGMGWLFHITLSSIQGNHMKTQIDNYQSAINHLKDDKLQLLSLTEKTVGALTKNTAVLESLSSNIKSMEATQQEVTNLIHKLLMRVDINK